MTSMARKRRWSRFVDRDSGKSLIVPIDHGLTVGPLAGLNRADDVLRWLDPDAVTGIVAHKGFAELLGGAPGIGLMIHLNGSISMGELPDMKVLVTSVEAALRLGADAVSLQTNFTAATAAHNLQMIGQVVDQAHAVGLPVLNMVYDKTPESGKGFGHLRHFMRAAVELGVDAIKVSPPASLDDVPALIDGIGECVPVLFAGGALTDERMLFDLAGAVVRHGAGGICVGRNVFQRTNPRVTMQRVLDTFRRAAAVLDYSRLGRVDEPPHMVGHRPQATPA